MAGEAWGRLWKKWEMPPAKQGSIEEVLHRQGTNDRYMLFDDEYRRSI